VKSPVKPATNAKGVPVKSEEEVRQEAVQAKERSTAAAVVKGAWMCRWR